MEAVEIVTGGSDHRRRRKGSSGHVVAPLLDSPLPTPRRSCCGAPGDAPPGARRRRGSADASPQRGHVPFKWESSPGVPRSAAAASAAGTGSGGEVPPPKPPPGRGGGPGQRACRHSNATEASNSDEGDTFSDALDRISSSDRLAALSSRLSAIDGVFGSLRSPSFIMDRFLPAANAIATTSADKRPRRSSPRRARHDREAAAAAARSARQHVASAPRRALAREQPKHLAPPRRSKGKDLAAAAQAPLRPRVDEEAQADRMTPRACGLMFFVPWSAKPLVFGFAPSPARSRTPRADAASVTTCSSPPRRSVTLGDVLEKERKVHDGGGLSLWYDEKSGSGKEWSSPGWGLALLGTSKRYCADARKALSRLARPATDGGDSPRVGRERRRGRPPASMLRSTSVKMPPLSPPSESWLSTARRSNAGNNKI